MALPKVTPGSYNYGAYANPQQVKLADTTDIARGIGQIGAGVTRAFDIKRQKEDEIAREDRAEARKVAGELRADVRQKEFEERAKQRQIETENRQEARLNKRELSKEFRSAYQLGRKLDSVIAKNVTDKNMQKAAESIQAIRNNKDLSFDEKMALLGAAEDNFEELLTAIEMTRTISGNKAILNVPANEILSEEGRIIQGLARSGMDDIIALSDFDGGGLGSEFTFQYIDENGVEKPISMTGYEIKNLLSNIDQNFEVKHVFGTQEDLAAVNLFKNVYDKSAMKYDELYYTDEGKLNESEYINMLMNDQSIVSQVTNTKSAASLYKTLTNGENYEPNNTSHREMIARHYAEAAMQSIKLQNPGIFDQPPTAEKQTGLTAESYNKLGSQGEKENALKVELIRRAQTGNIDALKSNKAFENFMFDGKVYKGTIIDEDGDEIEKTFTPSEMVDQYVNMMPKTWRASTEGSIFSKKQKDGRIDMGEFNQNVISQ